MKLKKSLALMFAACSVLAAALVVSGCTPMKEVEEKGKEAVDQLETAQDGGTLSFYVSEPPYIDPYAVWDTEGAHIVHALFQPMVTVDPKDVTQLKPGAATEWTPNEDATVWTFKLNPEGKFSDGTPVTANDFIYAFNRMVNPKTVNPSSGKVDPSTIGYHLAFVKGYEEVESGKKTEMSGLKAIDDHTLEITLSQPFADFAYVVSHNCLVPVPKALVEGGVDYNGKKVAYSEMPVGNGPFKMSDPWEHDQYIKMVRNDSFATGDKPHLDGIDFKVFKDPDTAYREFEAGNLDFTQIGEGQIKAAEEKYGTSPDGYLANPKQQVLLGAENSTYYLLINDAKKPFDNPGVRKALSLAINRQAICDIVFEGLRDPADNILPPGIAGYEKGAWVDAKYDIEAAKAALAEAGYPDGKGFPKVKLSFNNDGGHEKIMELLQADLKAIGIESTLDPSSWDAYKEKLDAGKFDMGRLGWQADYPIAYNFLYSLFDSKSGDNTSKYKNTDVDAGFKDAEKVTDNTARLDQFKSVNKTIGEANPVAPLMFYKHHHVASDRVHDLWYGSDYLADWFSVWIAQ